MKGKVFMLNGEENMIHTVKDCPCCGGEADVYRENFGKTAWVQCMECGLATSKYDVDVVVDGKNGIEWAVSRWNTRC